MVKSIYYLTNQWSAFWKSRWRKSRKRRWRWLQACYERLKMRRT